MLLDVRVALRLLLTCGALLAARAVAQDVTVGGLVWFSPEPPPDELPKSHGRLRPDYPDALRKTDEIGYVAVVRSIDEKGKSVWLTATATHVPLQRAVEAEFESWTLSAAKRGGKSVFGRVWLPVIFNPKSAAAKGADATPRLLAAAPVLTPTKPASSDGLPVVRMKLALDAGGAITRAEPEGKVSAKNLDAIQAALKQWRFAPARKNGEPVAAELTVPVICQTAPKTDTRESKPARVLDKVSAIYPSAMKRYGLSGQVTIGFDVDAEGRVQNPAIVESDNPAFDEPALTALRQWKFSPALREGEPVASHHLPVDIKLNSSGGEAFRINPQSDQSKLPPEQRYDTPPKIRGVLLPVYPYALRRDGVRGSARAAMLIAPNGHVTQVKVLDAAHPEFGQALAAALAGFRFDPAFKDGRPVPHVLAFEQEFNYSALSEDDSAELLALEKKHPEKIVAAGALDVPPKPISRREPLPPATLPAGANDGDAVVECLIDQEGRVRLPRIKSATDDAFGYAAVQAVSAWWFEPPLVDGQPVVVRAEFPFKFVAQPGQP